MCSILSWRSGLVVVLWNELGRVALFFSSTYYFVCVMCVFQHQRSPLGLKACLRLKPNKKFSSLPSYGLSYLRQDEVLQRQRASFVSISDRQQQIHLKSNYTQQNQSFWPRTCTYETDPSSTAEDEGEGNFKHTVPTFSFLIRLINMWTWYKPAGHNTNWFAQRQKAGTRPGKVAGVILESEHKCHRAAEHSLIKV